MQFVNTSRILFVIHFVFLFYSLLEAAAHERDLMQNLTEQINEDMVSE